MEKKLVGGGHFDLPLTVRGLITPHDSPIYRGLEVNDLNSVSVVIDCLYGMNSKCIVYKSR